VTTNENKNTLAQVWRIDENSGSGEIILSYGVIAVVFADIGVYPRTNRLLIDNSAFFVLSRRSVEAHSEW